MHDSSQQQVWPSLEQVPGPSAGRPPTFSYFRGPQALQQQSNDNELRDSPLQEHRVNEQAPQRSTTPSAMGHLVHSLRLPSYPEPWLRLRRETGSTLELLDDCNPPVSTDGGIALANQQARLPLMPVPIKAFPLIPTPVAKPLPVKPPMPVTKPLPVKPPMPVTRPLPVKPPMPVTRPLLIKPIPIRPLLGASPAAIPLNTVRKIYYMERPYACTVENCDRRFMLAEKLARHLRVHAGVKPYECKLCKRTFARSNHLAVHFRRHTGEKPFLCNYCRKGFTRSDQRDKHIERHIKEQRAMERRTRHVQQQQHCSQHCKVFRSGFSDHACSREMRQ